MTRRERRQARKAEKKKQLKRLIDAIEKAREDGVSFKPGNSPEDFYEVFKKIWPILDPALSYVKALKITRKKADKTLTDILAIGESIAIGGASSDKESEFKTKLTKIWRKVSTGLEIVQTFTPDHIDNILDDILDVGDWITGQE